MTDTAELIARLEDWRQHGGKVDAEVRDAIEVLAAQAQEIERSHESNRKLAQRNVWFTEAMQACQKLLCPDFGNCEPEKDGEKCACGFEGGSFANAIPKNRRAEAAEARVRELEALHDVSMASYDVMKADRDAIEAKTIERCARVVDECNREGPYMAIAAAGRIRALHHIGREE